MEIKEAINYLEHYAPLAYQESYDNSGVITGNVNLELSGVLICIDSTEEVVDEAIKNNCNLIVAHHPIIFSGLKKITGATYPERVLIKAIQNNIVIYAAHTNFDNIKGGVNSKIAEKLALKNCKILAPKKQLLRKLITFCPGNKSYQLRQALFAAGAGTVGNYTECSFNTEGEGTFKPALNTQPYVGEIGIQHTEKEVKVETIYPLNIEANVLQTLFSNHPYEEVAYDIISLNNTYNQVGAGIIGELEQEEDAYLFLKKIKKDMQTACVRHTEIVKKSIKKVAVCGGSGSFLLNQAIAQGADIFITSDFKYHQFFDAEKQILIADIGHYESEQYTKELFYDILKEKIPTFALYLSKINTNPVNYL